MSIPYINARVVKKEEPSQIPELVVYLNVTRRKRIRNKNAVLLRIPLNVDLSIGDRVTLTRAEIAEPQFLNCPRSIACYETMGLYKGSSEQPFLRLDKRRALILGQVNDIARSASR
ncbi:MAG: hypothetical protein NT076_02385 [Candidatus Pacearchaeota archaeon]|nr:hypothetical protein [Candidatus Pacearchaeota archaeon]